MEFLLGIVAAMIIFTLTEWLGKMVFEPVVQLRRAIGKLDGTLVMYANIYSNPGMASQEDNNRAHDAIRGASSELQAAIRRLVRTLVNGYEPSGTRNVSWFGENDLGQPVASGIYFYRLSSSSFSQTKKMVLLK
jgi:hypothetical protein